MAYSVEKSQKVGGEKSTDQVELIPIRWLVEQGLTSHWTQFRSFRRLFFLQVRRPNQQCQSTEGGSQSEIKLSKYTKAPLTR